MSFTLGKSFEDSLIEVSLKRPYFPENEVLCFCPLDYLREESLMVEDAKLFWMVEAEDGF